MVDSLSTTAAPSAVIPSHIPALGYVDGTSVLAQVLLWQAYHLGGPIGLIGLKCAVGGLCVWALFLAARATTDDPFVQVPVFLLATSIVARYFLFRPQLFTFACFAIYVAVLLRYLLRRSNELWVLPLVMLAWANLHGGFLAGVGALCLALALLVCRNANTFRQSADGCLRMPPSGTGSGGIGARHACEPAGLAAVALCPDGITHDTNRRYIAEWLPTLRAGDLWSTATITLLVLILLISGWWCAHKSRVSLGGRTCLAVSVSCVPLAGMAFLSVRHIPIAAIWIAPVATLLTSGSGSEQVGSPRARRDVERACSPRDRACDL